MAKVSLKMTKAEASAEGYGSPAEVKTPEYPWATCITLTNEVVKALWPDGLPKVGEELPLDVTAKVAGVSASDQDGGTSRVSVDLQLTDIEIEDPAETPSAAETIYGADGPKT
jgi:hypothetical protein